MAEGRASPRVAADGTCDEPPIRATVAPPSRVSRVPEAARDANPLSVHCASTKQKREKSASTSQKRGHTHAHTETPGD